MASPKAKRRLQTLAIVIALAAATFCYVWWWQPQETESTLVIDDAEAFENLSRLRRRRVSSHCRAMRTRGVQTSNFQNLFFMRERNILWCPVFKAASTAWIDNFLRLIERHKISESRTLSSTPTERKEYPIQQLKKALTVLGSRDDFLEATKNTTEMKSFMIVRHPFHRLVSAYRDKLERLHKRNANNYFNDYYYVQYGKEIVTRFRKQALKKFGHKKLRSKESNYGAPLPPEKYPRVPQLPTFWEFVQFLLNTDKKNEHWSPIYSECPVCSVSFDYIVHFENLEAEEVDLERALGVAGELDGRLGLLNANGRAGLTDERITELYFDTLDDADVRGLYRLYEWDFRMFGYEFQFRKMRFPPPND